MQTKNPITGETIDYNRIGGTTQNPIYYNDNPAQPNLPANSQTPITQPTVQPTNQPVNITTTSLQPTNGVSIPNVNTDTGSTGIISTVATNAQQMKEAQAQADALQASTGTGATDARNNLNALAKSLYGQVADVQGNQAGIENSLGIQEQQKALSDLNTQIASENVALRSEQDRIRNAPMSASQKQVENNNLNDTYGRRLADLAIRQSAAQGNVTAIQTMADRQTNMLLKPIQSQLEYLNNFEKDNVDYLDKKDQQKIALVKDSLDKQQLAVKDLQKAKTDMITEISQNGGGTKQDLIASIQKANSPEEVASLGAKSGYIGLLDRQIKQMQYAKLSAETKAVIAKNTEGQTPVSKVLQQAQSQDKINTISSLLKNPAIAGAVGPSFLSRGFFGGGTMNKLFGEQQNFTADVQKVQQQLTLDNLVNAKANGATFGALSEQELKLLQNSATKLNTWEIKDSKGNVKGYNAGEKDFKNELQKIQNFAKLDYIYKGGSPDDVGAVITNDGKAAVKNYDGTYTLLN